MSDFAVQGHDPDRQRKARTAFLAGMGRGLAGALLFALPMLMTMEMWQLGFYIGRDKLFLLLIINLPLLIILSHHIGFEETFGWREDLRAAIVAYGIGIAASGLILTLFGLLKPDMPASEVLGKIAVQAVPASIGAMFGRSQLTRDEDEACEKPELRKRPASYFGELFLMAVGALFLSLNVAPTEEMILLSYKMTAWHALATILLSITLMHGFVYAVSFEGGHELSPETPWWHALIRFTLPGYVIALAISLFSLWIFEQVDGTALTPLIFAVIVLAFPAAIGAAAARLIL
jgi:putative integral membrane protein (TIGR02587 family)